MIVGVGHPCSTGTFLSLHLWKSKKISFIKKQWDQNWIVFMHVIGSLIFIELLVAWLVFWVNLVIIMQICQRHLNNHCLIVLSCWMSVLTRNLFYDSCFLWMLEEAYSFAISHNLNTEFLHNLKQLIVMFCQLSFR